MTTGASGGIEREEGRALFGQDLSAYEAGRPQYPDEVYRALEQRCGLARGARVLEIGPGTGSVTRRLIEMGAAVLAVEPDANLAAHLRATFGDRLEVLQATFEAAEVAEGSVDLALAATSFHWVDQQVGLAKLGRSIRPGGALALWWTLYQDADPQAGVAREIDRILGPRTPSFPEEKGRPPFQLDIEHRLRDLGQWGGFDDLNAEIISTPRTLDAREMRAAFATLAVVLRRGPEDRAAVLDAIERLIRDQFGDRAECLFVTALYTGRRPGGVQGP